MGTAGAAGGSGNVTVTVASGGSVSGGAGGGYGVYIEQAAIAAISNAGTISALSGNAIYMRGSSVTVENNGTITGGIDLLGTSSTLFRNKDGGTFNATGTLNVGTGAVQNDGTLRLNGGNGAVRDVNVNGTFVQTSTGVMRTRADWSTGTADRLVVSGVANLAGIVVVDPLSFPSTGGLSKSFTVLTAGGGITQNGIAINNTAAVSYSLAYPDSNTLNVNATVNFAPTTPTTPTTPATPTTPPNGISTSGLTPNQLAIGRVLNTIYGGGTTLGFMPALMQLATLNQLGFALGQLSPIGTGGSFATAMATGNTFAGQLLSCRVAGEEGEATRFIKEGQCVWARVNARRFTNDNRYDQTGYGETATFFSAGAQLRVARDWRIGGGIGYEAADLTTSNSSSSTGDRLHLGGIVKYTPGPWLFAASVTGGLGWHDNRRVVSFPGFAATATSSNDSSFISSRLTAAHLISRGMFYAKPQVEFAATHLKRDGYTEHASGGIALSVGAADATVLSASPSLELGVETRSREGVVVRGFVRGGATIRDKDTFATSATFADAPAGSPSFSITSRVDKTVADVGAGIDIISKGDTSLRLQYDGQFGEHTTLHSGGAKLGIRF